MSYFFTLTIHFRLDTTVSDKKNFFLMILPTITQPKKFSEKIFNFGVTQFEKSYIT